MSKAFLPIKSDEDVFVLTIKKGIRNCPLVSISPIPTEHVTDGNKRLYKVKVRRNFIKTQDPKNMHIEEFMLEKGVKHKDSESWSILAEKIFAAYSEEYPGETMDPFLDPSQLPPQEEKTT